MWEMSGCLKAGDRRELPWSKSDKGDDRYYTTDSAPWAVRRTMDKKKRDYNSLNRKFLRAIRKDRPDARNRMILANQPFVTYLAQEYLKTCFFDPKPKLEDLQAIGMVGLVRACKRIKPDHPNPCGYLRKAINRELWQGAHYETNGGMSFEVNKKHNRRERQDAEKRVPFVKSLAIEERKTGQRHEKGVVWQQPRPNNELLAVELRDCMAVAAQDDVDRRILELIEAGDTQEEIAKKVGRHPSNIHGRIKRLEATVEELRQGRPLKKRKIQ